MSWNKSDGNMQEGDRGIPTSKAKIWIGLLSLLLFAVCGIVIIIFVAGKSDVKAPATSQTKNDLPVVEPKRSILKTNIVASAVVKEKTNAVERWRGRIITGRKVETNQQIIVETIYTDDGKSHLWYHEPMMNVLPTAADQLLAMMTATDSGTGAPPLPAMPNFENEFGDALKRQIVIEPEDSPKVREVKERVIAARKEMLDLMAQGIPAQDVIKEYQLMQENNATLRMDAVRRVQEFLSLGDTEGATKLCEEYNKVLRQAGIMEIEIPNRKNRIRKELKK